MSNLVSQNIQVNSAQRKEKKYNKSEICLHTFEEESKNTKGKNKDKALTKTFFLKKNYEKIRKSSQTIK